MTGAELARRLEVDIRTVRHYVEVLGDLGIPVEAVRGRYGAYRLRAGYKLPPLIFTEDESEALILSLLLARANGLATTAPAIEGVLAKVERVLPATTRSRIQAMEQTVIFESQAFYAPPQARVVTILSESVQTGRRLRLHYRSARLEVTERAFDPYGVVYHEGLWYTIGYCHLRQEQRLFRLDRILSVSPLDETFPLPGDFSALSAVQRALASVPSVWQIEVYLQTTLEEALRQSSLSSAYFEETSQGVLVRGEVEDLLWAARRLASLGVPFMIHRPLELRTILRQHALTIASYAEQTEEVCIPEEAGPTLQTGRPGQISSQKANKRGRTPRERKSAAGRKTQSRRGVARQPRQLSLDVRTIACLDAMQVNNSELFERLLQHYPPFVEAWTKAGYALSELSEVGANI
jgi:predicted DNA-binding transcriptional regulator YafY